MKGGHIYGRILIINDFSDYSNSKRVNKIHKKITAHSLTNFAVIFL